MPEVPRKPHVSFALDGEVLDRVNNLNEDHFLSAGICKFFYIDYVIDNVTDNLNNIFEHLSF